MVISKNNRRILALILLLLLGMIWGSGYSLARYAMTHGVPPLGYAFWQSFGAAILLLIITRCCGIRLQWPHRSFYFVCGLLGIAIPNTTMYFSAVHLPAGLLAVIVNVAPIITYVLALAFKQERFNGIRFLGVIFGFTGIMIMVLPGATLPTSGVAGWILLTMIAPLCFSLSALYATQCRPAGSHSLGLSAGMLCVSTVLLAPLVFFTGDFYPLMPPFSMPEKVVMLEIVLASIGYVVFFQLIKTAGPVYYSLVSGVVMLTGLFWGWLLFSEQLTSMAMLAVGLILLAITLITIRLVPR